MAYSSDPHSYAQNYWDLLDFIMESREKITWLVNGDKSEKNRTRSKFYGFQHALLKESKKLKENGDEFMGTEYERRARKMLRYTVIIEEGKNTIVFMNKDALMATQVTSVVVSERTVNDYQAQAIDLKLGIKSVEERMEAQEKLQEAIERNPFKPHSPDDPNSALNQPITEDDMIALLSAEDSAKKEGA